MRKAGVITHWVLLGGRNGSVELRSKLSGRSLVIGLLYQGYCRIRDYSCTRLEEFDGLLNRSQRIWCYGIILLCLLILAVLPLFRSEVSTSVTIHPQAVIHPLPLPSRVPLAPDTLIHAITLKPIIYENEQK